MDESKFNSVMTWVVQNHEDFLSEKREYTRGIVKKVPVEADDDKDTEALTRAQWIQTFSVGKLVFNKDGSCIDGDRFPEAGRWSVKDGVLTISGTYGKVAERTFTIKWLNEKRLAFFLLESGMTQDGSFYGGTGFTAYEK